jgi:hypothetical protein
MNDPGVSPTETIDHAPSSRVHNLSSENSPLPGQPGWLVHLDWDNWLEYAPRYPDGGYTLREAVHRYERNGYQWDIHGTLYEPAFDRYPGLGFVMTHGGAGSEWELRETPDGRPGLAPVLAAQGLRCLVVTYPGHYPASGVWTEAVETRQPVYLLDRELSEHELRDRHLKCTYNVIVQGMAGLTDALLAGRDVFAFGHSTGGPMAVSLQRFVKHVRIKGILGWGSGGPDGWYHEWEQWIAPEHDRLFALDVVQRRSVASFRAAGYEDPPELTPWGDAHDYMEWGNRYKSQMKTGLCDNQHSAHVGLLHAYARETGLPVSEYIDHLGDPDPDWLSQTGVLLLTGEQDRQHWLRTASPVGQLERYFGEKFSLRAARTRVVVVPKYGHFGFAGLHNEKIIYYFLDALHAGFFGNVVSTAPAEPGGKRSDQS